MCINFLLLWQNTMLKAIYKWSFLMGIMTSEGWNDDIGLMLDQYYCDYASNLHTTLFNAFLQLQG